VEVSVDIRTPENRRAQKVKIAFATAIAVSVCWSASALGRTQSGADCDKLTQGLERLAAPAAQLTIEPVDHVTIDAGNFDTMAMEVQIDSDDTATPQLYLTPRVTDALRDIFATGPDLYPQDPAPELASSPLAETEDPADIAETADAIPVTEADNEIALPLLQRQMYRTDI